MLAALPIPLGSLIELLVPPHWPGQPECHLLLWSRHLPSPRLGCLLHFLMLLRQRWHRQRPCLAQRRLPATAAPRQQQ
jgi:hypothetical protein